MDDEREEDYSNPPEPQQELWKIQKFSLFKNYIKTAALDLVPQECRRIIRDKTIIDMVMRPDIRKEIDEETLEAEIRRYILVNENDEDMYYILKEDLVDLILSVSSHMITNILDNFVEQGILELYWDNTIRNFMWKTKKGK